mmetsp:Transcript_97465/g.303562  ORF Transcript_97465/g.303562 Transcript_97465/m.303562 type:complete len:208 (+) Transcript_97465:897-1520(+)
MSGKCPNDVVDPRSLGSVRAGHEVLWPADHPNGQATAQGLAVADDVRLHVVGALGAARVQPEARIDLIEDEHHAGISARLPELVEPLLVAWRRANLAGVAGENGITWRRLVQVKALQRVDQDSCNLPFAGLNYLQREVAHVLQAENILREALVARNRLHAIPPAMVSASKRHDQGLLCVEACNPHRAHHRLRARHVEGHLVVPRDLS